MSLSRSQLKVNNIAKKLVFAAVFVCLSVFGLLIWQYMDHGDLDVSFYQLQSEKLEDDIRIVMISDLHMREFGEGNSVLLKKIENLQPDIITVVGDLTNYPDTEYGVALKLLVDLQEIAPVYYSYGNHEYSDILFISGSTLRRDIKNTGVTVVNNSSVTVQVKNTTLAIGGICTGSANFYDNASKFLDEFVLEENFKLLLCHHPECFEECMKNYPVDLALAGHAHGGQIRLTGLGALFAPDQGLLPKLTEGMQVKCGSPLVISRGLGNTEKIPRFNNNPEIVVVDLLR